MSQEGLFFLFEVLFTSSKDGLYNPRATSSTENAPNVGKRKRMQCRCVSGCAISMCALVNYQTEEKCTLIPPPALIAEHHTVLLLRALALVFHLSESPISTLSDFVVPGSLAR